MLLYRMRVVAFNSCPRLFVMLVVANNKLWQIDGESPNNMCLFTWVWRVVYLCYGDVDAPYIALIGSRLHPSHNGRDDDHIVHAESTPIINNIE